MLRPYIRLIHADPRSMLIFRIFIGLVLAYVGLVILAWRFQERLAFPAPRALLPDPQRVGVANGERVQLVSSDGTNLVGWYLKPEVGGGRGRLFRTEATFPNLLQPLQPLQPPPASSGFTVTARPSPRSGPSCGSFSRPARPSWSSTIRATAGARAGRTRLDCTRRPTPRTRRWSRGPESTRIAFTCTAARSAAPPRPGWPRTIPWPA